MKIVVKIIILSLSKKIKYVIMASTHQINYHIKVGNEHLIRWLNYFTINFISGTAVGRLCTGTLRPVAIGVHMSTYAK